MRNNALAEVYGLDQSQATHSLCEIAASSIIVAILCKLLLSWNKVQHTKINVNKDKLHLERFREAEILNNRLSSDCLLCIKGSKAQPVLCEDTS